MNLMTTILGNFALILFVLTVFTGTIWVLELFYFSKKRRVAANLALAEYDERQNRLTAEGIKLQQGGREELESRLMHQSAWIEYTGSFFPVIALVFFFRSFLFEPFKIPSESMVPTLVVGDLILVNKFTYGIRLPVINKKIVQINNPQRGDVMVFKFPVDNSTDYIKRVVGLPGDKIEYRNKRLSVNGKPLQYQTMPDYLNDTSLVYSKQLTEDLTGMQHRILNTTDAPNYDPRSLINFPNKDACKYDDEGFLCTVPAGNYFMMGDNRDNSTDSRYWGFVPDENIVGKAFFVWLNFGSLKRIGSIQ